MGRRLLLTLTAVAALPAAFWPAGAAAQSCLTPFPDAPLPERASETRLHLTIQNVRPLRGDIVITLYGPNPALWLRPNGSLHRYKLPARAPTTQACILLPGPGRYAVGIYHDRNSNVEIDRDFLGIPMEGVGLSNNPSLFRFAFPRLAPSLLTVNRTDTATAIRMHYPG